MEKGKSGRFSCRFVKALIVVLVKLAKCRFFVRITSGGKHHAVIELNWIVAASMVYGPARGLQILAARHLDETLATYHLFHATRADFLRRSGCLPQAREAYQQALNLCQNASEQAFLRRRIREVSIMLQEE